MAYSLTRPPGDASFYWLTFALAAVWTTGSLLSGPLHLGRTTWRATAQRPVIIGVSMGLLLGAIFLAGGLAVRSIPAIAEPITRVLEYTNYGPPALIVVIALVNAVAEELFFRGALYTALGRCYPVVISTLLYAAATLATGNPMLAFAGVILGSACGLQRRATGGVLAPILTHVVWGRSWCLGCRRSSASDSSRRQRGTVPDANLTASGFSGSFPWFPEGTMRVSRSVGRSRRLAAVIGVGVGLSAGCGIAAADAGDSEPKGDSAGSAAARHHRGPDAVTAAVNAFPDARLGGGYAIGAGCH